MTNNEYKEWEQQVKETKKHNKQLLAGFEKWLTAKSLKPKTIKNHIGNLDFYADAYLLRYDIIPLEEGGTHIGMFLGDYFIRKTTWPANIPSKKI
ncbi:MAG TPA: hypothetical protein ENJ95_14380 [Bacteroidetes bacterium]|nr:hypothetical protein [Bacteroidota bacterium]